jgi:hypothetical protein
MYGLRGRFASVLKPQALIFEAIFLIILYAQQSFKARLLAHWEIAP